MGGKLSQLIGPRNEDLNLCMISYVQKNSTTNIKFENCMDLFLLYFWNFY